MFFIFPQHNNHYFKPGKSGRFFFFYCVVKKQKIIIIIYKRRVTLFLCIYLFFFFQEITSATHAMAVHSDARTLRGTLLIYTGILRTIDINEKITRDPDCRISGISLYFRVVGPLDVMVIKRMFQKNASNRTATPYTKIVFDCCI